MGAKKVGYSEVKNNVKQHDQGNISTDLILVQG